MTGVLPAEQVTGVAADRRPAVAPFLVARVSGLSSAALDAVTMRRSMTSVARVGHARERQRVAAEPVVAALHALVPLLDDDRRLRRAALALKRAVHNDRPVPVSSTDLDALTARLPESERDLLAAWLGLAEEVRTLVAEADSGVGTELTSVATGLVEACATPTLARALSLASPTLTRDLRRPDAVAKLAPGTRLSRSCLGYLIRATVKTSPFSTFTTIGEAAFAPRAAGPGRDSGPVPGPAPGPTYAGRTRVSLSRALATELVLALAVAPEFGPALRYRAAEGVVWLDGYPVLLVPRSTCSDGFFWRHEDLVRADAYRPLLERLDPGRVLRYEELRAGFAELTISRLVELGLVRPIAPWAPDSDSCLPELAGPVVALSTPAGSELARTLTELAGSAGEVATAPPEQRSQRIESVRAAAHSAFALAGRVPPAWLDEAPLLHEDVATEVAVPALGAHVRGDLERLAEALYPRIFRTHLYAHLVDHFVARYGPGGTCANLLDFLYSFMRRADARTLLTTSAQQDRLRQPLVSDPDARVAPSPYAPRFADLDAGPRPAATVLFQLAAYSAEAVARGDYQLVVNQVQAGIGGMVARFLPLLGTGTDLAIQLRQWVSGLCGDALPLELPVVSDWSGLQHPTGLFPRLRWPGEVPAKENDAVAVADLGLSHDPGSGFLTVRRPDGRPVAPVYLAIVPPRLMLGPLRLLLTLADPWVLPAPAGAQPRPFDPPPPAPTEVQREDRASDGRLVLRRRSWRVPVEELPAPRAGESPFELLARADAWRRRWGIPEEVFATAQRRHFSLESGKRKPAWLSFASVHALAHTAALLDEDVVAVNLTEALPDRRHGWLPDPDGRPRTGEFVSLLGWPDGGR
jgi:hypothetical protein